MKAYQTNNLTVPYEFIAKLINTEYKEVKTNSLDEIQVTIEDDELHINWFYKEKEEIKTFKIFFDEDLDVYHGDSQDPYNDEKHLIKTWTVIYVGNEKFNNENDLKDFFGKEIAIQILDYIEDKLIND